MLDAISRLPGISFSTESRLVDSTLPRMDIAGFVGFCSKGPLHLPVAIEDYAQFREVFGEDVSLAWDSENRRMQYSYLGASVEAFFRNGGIRCWIVRVASEPRSTGDSAATTQYFYLPGMYRIDKTDEDLARIEARSPGSWADSLRLGTRLLVRSLAVSIAVDSSTKTSPPPRFFSADSGYRLHIRAVPADLVVGDLIEMRFGDSGLGLYFYVDNLVRHEQGAQLQATSGYWYQDPIPTSPAISSPADTDAASNKRELLSQAAGLDIYTEIENQSPPIVPVIRRLRFDILVWDGDALSHSLQNLAFDKRHPRFWGKLPDDKNLYGELLLENPVNHTPGFNEFLADLSHPRFPLAAEETLLDESNAVYLPLAMQSHSNLATTNPAAGSIDIPTYPREGLESFSADLFLDGDIAQSTSATVLSEAEHKRFVRNKKLKGIHSLLPIDEISMISVPDCIHRHWDFDPPRFDIGISAPILEALGDPDEHGRRKLRWQRKASVRRYLVQQSLKPDFADSKNFYIERPTRKQFLQDEDILLDAPEVHLKLVFADECPVVYYFRVRAEGYGVVSPWSNTRAARIPESSFYSCENPTPVVLGLLLDKTQLSPAGESILLFWGKEDDFSLDLTADDIYELQLASDADFISAKTVYKGSDTELEQDLQADSVVYYRVRRIASDVNGPWSNTKVMAPEIFSVQTLNTEEEYDHQDLLAVHYAMMRFCQARADAIAVLSVPAHYQMHQLSIHLAALNPPDDGVELLDAMQGSGELHVPPLNWSEASALRFTAIYHPWLSTTVGRDFDASSGLESNRLLPPDGAVCGKMAASAAERGAWFASANKLLEGVLGLSYQFDASTAGFLIANQVNLVHPDPDGFVVINDDSLSKTDEFRPLSVRRLMILIRRLIRREGNHSVFEPNSASFRRGVESYWNRILLGLYQGGAFKGKTADAAFRIVTDESVNDQRSQELGRFIVEIHVAPSQPMKFINVRLIQSGPDQLAIQEL